MHGAVLRLLGCVQVPVGAVVERCQESRAAVVIDDCARESQYRPLAQSLRGSAPVRSLVCIPMLSGRGKSENLVGTIEGRHPAVAKFSRAQAARIARSLRLAGDALERVEAQVRVARLQAELPQLLAAPSVRALLLAAEVLAERYVPGVSAGIFVHDCPAGKLWVESLATERRERFDVSLGLVGHTARTGNEVYVRDAVADRRFHAPADAAKWGSKLGPPPLVTAQILPIFGPTLASSTRQDVPRSAGAAFQRSTLNQ